MLALWKARDQDLGLQNLVRVTAQEEEWAVWVAEKEAC
jgi:hypothetical protein